MLKILKILKTIFFFAIFVIFCNALFVFIIPGIAKYFMLQSGMSKEAVLYICNSITHVGEISIIFIMIPILVKISTGNGRCR